MNKSPMKVFFEKRINGVKWSFLPILAVFILYFSTPLWALAIAATAPNFTLENLDGQKVSLRDYQGKIVILKLGTTWCPGCRDQDKELRKIDALITAAGITLIQVFLDDPVAAIKRYQQGFPMQSPVVTVVGDEQLKRNYGVYAIPRLLILSPEQKIIRDATGMRAEEIEDVIRQYDKKTERLSPR